MSGPRRDALARRDITARERNVLDLLTSGSTNAAIGARLGISERTVESHVSSLLHKVGVANRTALVQARLESPMPQPHGFPQQLSTTLRRDRCVGRDGELDQLWQWWNDASAGVKVALVTGPAGIGKSLLVATAAAGVHERGGRVLLGVCTDASSAPYEPFLAALGGDATGSRHDGDQTSSEIDGAAREIIDPARDHTLVLAHITSSLAKRAADQAVLLVLEDLHRASTGTLAAFVQIARIGGPGQLMVLATARDEPSSSGPMATIRAALAGVSTVESMALQGLDSASAAVIISSAGSQLDPEHAVRETRGNPLFLRELARGGPGSLSLRALVADRFGQLDELEVDVVDVGAVLGADIDAHLVARALGADVDVVLDALERIENTGVIGPAATHGHFAFTHDLFRDVRYEALPTGRRMRLHAIVATALARDQRVDIAERARHACLAGPRFDPRVAADLAVAAGDLATAATDHGAAAIHYRRAAQALSLTSAAEPQSQCSVAIRLGAAQVLLGDPAGYTLLLEAGDDALHRDDPVSAAAAFCALSPSPGGSAPGRHRGDAELGARVLDRLPPSEARWRVRVLATLGLRRLLSGDRQMGPTMIADALAAARLLADPYTLGRALMTARFVAAPFAMDERIGYGHELIALGDQLGEELFTLVGAQHLCWCHRELGNVAEMARWHAVAARRVIGPDLEQLVQEPAAAALRGDLASAVALVDALAAVAEPIGMGATYVEPIRQWINDWRGQMRDPRSLATMLAGRSPMQRLGEALLARTLARTGSLEEAGALLTAATERNFEPRDAPYQSTMSGSCWAEVAFICNEPLAASQIREWFEPLAGRFVDSGVQVWDTVDRVRALAELTLGHDNTAADLAAHAVAASRARDTPIFLARELVVLAAARQRTGDDDIGALIREAGDIAARTGASLIRHDIRLFLDGDPLPAEQPRLSVREREVMVLVGKGDTNRQIANALGISATTVRKHLEHVFAKLDVSTRTAAVARLRDDDTAGIDRRPR